MNNIRLFACLAGFAGLFILSGCASPAPENNPTPAIEEPTSVQALSTPIPSVAHSKALTICLAEEPASLYMYDNLSASALSVLAAIYDGPIDSNAYTNQAVILQKLPSLEDGDAVLEPVTVQAGDKVVDANGVPVTLAAGTLLHPSECSTPGCVIIYDGSSEIEMEQMVVNFTLLPGLTWSDGEALTADDSVYSFQLASDVNTPGSKYLVNRTQAYQAVDDLTLQWTGLPGYLDQSFASNYWTPAPRHAWKTHTPAEMSQAVGRQPLGWGAYIIDQWLPGESIHLVKNTRYFRAEEGLPRFNDLYFYFVSDPNLAISRLIGGSCDLLDPGMALDGQIELLQAFAANHQLKVRFSNSMNLEQLDFGIRPAAYDNGFNLADGDRPDLFADVRTRQAFAMCLDRQKVVDEILFGLSDVPSSFIPVEHPFYAPDVTIYEYDPVAGNRLLDEVGWIDQDNDPLTTRQAHGIPGVPDGTPLNFSFVTTAALQRRLVSAILVKSLTECGAEVDVQYLDPVDLYRVGSGSPLFGRRFDLAEFALAGTGLVPPCNWYLGSEIPSPQNSWSGINFSGYTDRDYDSACLSARTNLGQDSPPAEAYAHLQEIFSEDLPVIPLYWQVKVGTARVGLCGFYPDPTSTSSLWNIEQFSWSTGCPGE